jgi:hypothetical protein
MAYMTGCTTWCGGHVQEFPFALVSINISKWALDLAAAGALNAAAARRASLVDTVEKWYIGTFYHFEALWLARPATAADIGDRIAMLERHAKAKAPAMIDLARKRTPGTLR